MATDFSSSNLYGASSEQIIECIAQATVNCARPVLGRVLLKKDVSQVLGAIYSATCRMLSEAEYSKEELTSVLQNAMKDEFTEFSQREVRKALIKVMGLGEP